MGGYPSTNFEWINNSVRSTAPISTTIRDKAILMTACSSDKGYEDFRVVDKDFIKIYGDISFAKYGQGQIQAAAILEAGGSLYHKRVVSKKAKLAHIGLDITLTKTSTQKTDKDGALLYTTSEGAETTESEGNKPIMIPGVKLKFGTSSVSGEPLLKAGDDPKEIARLIKDTYTDWATADINTAESIKFPWFVVTETGRGKSKKKIRITPDYASSKSSTWTKYSLSVLEDNDSVDNIILFSMDPDVIDSSTQENRSIDTVINKRSIQLRCVSFEDSILRLFDCMSTVLGKKVSYFKENDILFGCTRKGYELDGITIDPTGVNINSIVGIDLLNGDNGDLKDYPLESAEYNTLLTEVFNGTASADIYDINNNRINAIFDANYPAEVKRAIEAFVSFREDIFFFRDLGIDLRSIDDIILADVNSLKSKFCASYHNSYDIYEPNTKKQITVTCMYDLVSRFINHEISGVGRPFAGMLYGITFTDSHIIQDSINFIPKKIPGYDQLAMLADAKINYMVRYSGTLTMDTEYTSDEIDSDFSYINNILAIQDIIRLIRIRCPKTRYTFKTQDDYESYKKDVEAVLNNRQSNFQTLAVEFLADEEQKDDKAVYAAISVKCKPFIDKEYFKIIAL